jgi:hypothetical protein
MEIIDYDVLRIIANINVSNEIGLHRYHVSGIRVGARLEIVIITRDSVRTTTHR